jgi:type III secretion protein U
VSEKNLPASTKRLREAKDKGQVAQTPAVSHLLATIGVIELCLGERSYWMPHLQSLLVAGIDHLRVSGSPMAFGVDAVILPMASVGIVMSISALLTATVLALMGNVAQVGFMVASNTFFRLEKFDPVANAKNMFSAEKLIGVGTNVVKTVGIALCAGVVMVSSLSEIVHSADGDLDAAAEVFFYMLRRTERLATALLLVMVSVDWVLKKYFFLKSQRMDREEKERESKDMFGDKHVRQGRKSLQSDILGGQLVESTRSANAVVTNPTHFAVALLYDPKRFALPIVVCRGANASAELIKKIAREEGIPVIRSVWLARTLYSVGRERRPIPRLTIKAVAAVYRAIAEAAAESGVLRGGELDLSDVADAT